MVKKLFTLSIILFSFFAKADYWTQKANFPALAKMAPFCFSIADKGYLGGGQDVNHSVSNEFWEYSPSNNSWTQKANFPGSPRWFGTGFSIGNKGYAGTGGNASNVNPFADFWEYNPATNGWSQKADFGGGQRTFAVGFSAINMGYIATGDYIGTFNDIWQYDPILNIWNQKSNLIGPDREDANAFTLYNNGYIVAGINGQSSWGNGYDLWEYNTISDSWTQKSDFPGLARCDAAAFSICEKGYFGTGESDNYVYDADFWEYNALTNIWTQKSNFPGIGRDEAAFFSIGQKGYIGIGGQDGYSSSGIVFNDFWEYTPDSACTTGIDEFQVSGLKFQVSPNPAKDFIVINYPLAGKENITITITNTESKKVYETKLLTFDFRLSVSNFQKGIYFVELTNGKEKEVKTFMKE